MFVESTCRLTDAAVMEMLRAGIAEADNLGQPQCIVIVDSSGETLGQFRMSGAKFLSLKSARTKARTAASIGVETVNIPDTVAPAIAAATGGDVTALPGGLPIIVGEVLLGGIGVGSGSGDQDRQVAIAALTAIAAKV